jgi:hypothetical protein
MPRRFRALVALAALAGCSLAGSDGNAKCTNSCYCDSSGSAASRPPPLLGASPQSPSLHAQFTPKCGICFLKNATYGVPWDPKDAMPYIEARWNKGERSFNVENNLLGEDPAPGFSKKLNVTVLCIYRVRHADVDLIERSLGEGTWLNFDECP